MSSPLRILILEDNPSDAELFLHELRQAGFDPDWQRVETEEDYLAALDPALDVILSDYSLPQFDGLRALHLLNERDLNIPFIVVSGTIGEHIAVECMRLGAADYLLKDRLARLGPAVMNALEQKRLRNERGQAEAALRDSEQRFRALIENSSDGIVLLSAEGSILYDSPAVTQVLGYAPDERMGRRLFEFMHPDDRQASAEQIAQLARKPGAVVSCQARFRHKDGSWRQIEGVRSSLLDEPGVQAIVVNYRDMTERVRAEQRLAVQYAVARCLAESDTLADAAPKILQAICESLEWDQGEAWSVLWNADLQANVLRCVGTWHPPSASFPEFEAVTRQIEFAPGVGLPGRVWASGEPAWIPDVTQDPNFPRAPTAAKEGLRAGFAFPLKPDGGVFGVMGFFSRDIRQPDNDLLLMFTSLSNQIGQFIQRKQAEEALKESEKHFRSLIENASDVITVLDGAGTILYESPSIERVLGYKPEELLGRNAFELVHPEERADIVEVFARGFQSPESTPLVEARIRHKDDSWRVVEMIGKPAPDRTGQMIGIVNSRDITERKRAEEETRLLLALIQAINAAPDFDSALRVALQKVCESTEWDMGETWIPRADGSALELSPIYYCQRPGLEEFITHSQSLAFLPGEGLPGRVWASRQPEWLKDVSTDGEIFPRAATAMQAGIKAALAVPMVAGGQLLVLVFFMRQAREQEKELVGIVSATATQLGSLFQRKRAEERLRESEERYRTLAEAAHDAIFVLDRDERFQYFNTFAAREFGKRPDEVIGKLLAELFPPEAYQARRRSLQEVFETGKPVYAEVRTPLSGRDGWSGTWLAPIRDEAGEVRAVLGIARDITDRKLAEETLQAKTEEVRALSQQLWQAGKLATMGELAASIAHELNNPLGTIGLRLESLLQQVPEGDVKRRALEIIDGEVERMAGLVANLLQVSRRGPQRVSTVTVADEINRAFELMGFHLRDRKIEAVLDLAPDAPPIRGERQMLLQLFLNLLSNAVDAMPEGGRLTVRTGPAGGGVLVEVSDTGEGVPADVLPHIAEPFYTTKPEGKGTGLGLAICRRIVQEHGGTIDFHSEGVRGRGTTVRIVLRGTENTNDEALRGR